MTDEICDCPACAMTRVIQQAKADGADIEHLIPLFFAIMGEVFDAEFNTEVLELTANETVH